jgi:hypothetical protein
MRRGFFVIVFLAFCPLVFAQQSLNNDAVVKLVKAGLSDDLIVATVNASPGTYDISADGLIALKKAGASDKVVAAVVLRASAPPPPAENHAAAGGPAAAPANNEGAATSSEPVSRGVAETPEAGAATGFGPVSAGARIVIAPMGGFETYFAAAVREKKVPVILTLDKASAQYFVVSTNTEWQGFVYGAGGAANWNRRGGSAAFGSSANSTRGLEASIMLIDAKTKDIIWAYEVHKNSNGALLFGTFGARGQQSIAEACAKHLKEYIEKGK